MKVRRLQITIDCIECNGRFRFMVAAEDYQRWRDGRVTVRRAFTYLSSGERALMVVHVCGRCVVNWMPTWK